MYYNSDLMRFFMWAPIAPECLIVFLVFRRRIFHEVSWFTLYLIFEAATTLGGLAIYQWSDPWYFYVSSWLQSFVLSTIGFMVIAEVFRNLLARYPVLAKIGVRLFFTTALVLVSIALLSAGLGADHSAPLLKSILLLRRSIMLIQVGLVVVIFAFSSYFGVDWRSHQFGIALGFGLIAAVRLSITAYTAQIGTGVGWKCTIIEECAYLATVLLWTMYFVRAPQRPPSSAPSAHEPDLERWNEALSELLSR